jgi:hypothetical protein
MSIDNLEPVGKMNPQKLTSLEEDAKKEQEQIKADTERWERYGTNSQRKAALSKREIMEEMTRERFPWEE